MTSGTLSTGITLTTTASPAPVSAPTGLIATRAIQTKDGWRGQIIVAEEIVWESDYGSPTAREAAEDATYRVLDRIKRLVTDPHPNDPELFEDEDGRSDPSADAEPDA